MLVDLCDLPAAVRMRLASLYYELPDWDSFRVIVAEYSDDEARALFHGATACIEPRVGGGIVGWCGVPGSGKSSRAAEVARAALSKGLSVTWFDTEGSCPVILDPSFTVYRTFDALQLVASARLMGRADLVIVDSLGFAFRHCDDRECMLRLLIDTLLDRGGVEAIVVNQTTTDAADVLPLLGKLWFTLCNSKYIIYWGV